MKKLIYILTVGFSTLLLIISCDQVLNQRPKDQFSGETVWNDPALVEAYINDLYLGMGHGLHNIMLSSMADETHFTHGYGVPDIVQSNISPSNLGNFRGQWVWDNLYSNIQKVNKLLANIRSSKIENQERLNSFNGQAHFLRAYFYHNLLRMYGGVPIITKPSGLKDDLLVERNSFAETVEFIVAEADTAAQLLPAKQSGDDLGRASGGAALALKSRVLIFAASDLFQKNPSGMAVTGYSSKQNQQQRWREAKDAAQEVMKLDEYNLFRPHPSSPEEASNNYYELFLTENNSETIMERYFIKSRDDNYNVGLYNGPNGYLGWAGNEPLQNLVDDFEMLDGSEFDWNNPKHAANPYESRDPRFDASILHDGSHWMQRPPDAATYDKSNVVQTVSELILPDGQVVAGVDTRDGPIQGFNGSYTSYYMKKYIRDDFQHRWKHWQKGIWIYFRYTEPLLNYVEASIELGEDTDARRALNKIRTRAYMPTYDNTVSGKELMEEYRNERRVELAFEGHRYFDVRRWMIAPEVMNEDAKGIEITAKASDQADRSTYHDYKFKPVTISPGKRVWDDKMYFRPIPYEEMNRNKNLIQNPGY